MLEPARLKTILEVERRGSLAAAAEALGYTPSAVSQQIVALERQLGTRLVDRGPRGARLTDAGTTLASHAARIVDAIDAAVTDVAAVVGLRSGRLRLGWFATAGATLMPRAIATFRRRHPEVELALTEADPDRSARLLRDDGLDLALIYDFPLTPALPADLSLTHLLDDRLYVALPRAHRLSSRKRLRLGELVAEPWIQGVRSGSTLEVLPTACRAAGFDAKIAFRTDDHAAMQGLVAAGVGLGLIPAMALPNARRDLVVRAVSQPALVRRVFAATSPGGSVSPAARAMIAILVEIGAVLVDDASSVLRAT